MIPTSNNKMISTPTYNAALESEDNIINLDHVHRITPHANVPVDPGAVSTVCCEAFFHFGTSVIILLPYTDIKDGISAWQGLVNVNGEMI